MCFNALWFFIKKQAKSVTFHLNQHLVLLYVVQGKCTVQPNKSSQLFSNNAQSCKKKSRERKGYPQFSIGQFFVKGPSDWSKKLLTSDVIQGHRRLFHFGVEQFFTVWAPRITLIYSFNTVVLRHFLEGYGTSS